MGERRSLVWKDHRKTFCVWVYSSAWCGFSSLLAVPSGGAQGCSLQRASAVACYRSQFSECMVKERCCASNDGSPTRCTSVFVGTTNKLHIFFLLEQLQKAWANRWKSPCHPTW